MKGNFCQPQRQFSLEYFGIREARSMSMPRQLPAVAVSACLTGQAVRYDGGHRHQAELLDALADRLELLPLCPEFRLGIPRPPVQRVLTRQGRSEERRVGKEWSTRRCAEQPRNVPTGGARARERRRETG